MLWVSFLYFVESNGGYGKGQMKFNKTIEDFLIKVLSNEAEKPVVRHEVSNIISNNFIPIKNRQERLFPIRKIWK